jgi:hypothetical protein
MAKRNEIKVDFAKLRLTLLEEAEKKGLTDNYNFMTTFDRYCKQVELITKLSKVIEEDGELVTKEYVKGRENVYIHPAIKELNNTSNSANNTVSTLLKILAATPVKAEKDELDEFLS